jgi:fumarate hydratase subunit alpha
MRTIEAPRITETISRLCMEANYNLGADMLAAFDRASSTERSPAGRDVLALLKENAYLARTQRVPYCQDTGFVICFADICSFPQMEKADK